MCCVVVAHCDRRGVLSLPLYAALQRIIITGQYFSHNQSYLEAVKYGRGLAYSPYQSCVVLTHENISCLTVPGVGANLMWQVGALTLEFPGISPLFFASSICSCRYRLWLLT